MFFASSVTWISQFCVTLLFRIDLTGIRLHRYQAHHRRASKELPLRRERHIEEEHQALAKTLGNFILIREKLKKCPKNATWMQKKTAMKPK